MQNYTDSDLRSTIKIHGLRNCSLVYTTTVLWHLPYRIYIYNLTLNFFTVYAV